MIDDKFTMSAVLHCIIDQEVVQSFCIKPYREKNWIDYEQYKEEKG